MKYRVEKTSLVNKQVTDKGDYIAIIASYPHNCVGKACCKCTRTVIQGMSDVLLCIHVVVITLNLDNANCCYAYHHIKALSKSVWCCTTSSPQSANQIIDFLHVIAINVIACFFNSQPESKLVSPFFETHKLLEASLK